MRATKSETMGKLPKVAKTQEAKRKYHKVSAEDVLDVRGILNSGAKQPGAAQSEVARRGRSL